MGITFENYHSINNKYLSSSYNTKWWWDCKAVYCYFRCLYFSFNLTYSSCVYQISSLLIFWWHSPSHKYNQQFYFSMQVRKVDRENRIVMMSSDEGLRLLCERDIEVFADGTFKYCPSYFFQLLTFHVFKNGFYIPSVFFLLPDKKQRHIYRRFSSSKQKPRVTDSLSA